MPRGVHHIQSGSRSCANCGAEYQPIREEQKFCRSRCRYEHHNRQKLEKMFQKAMDLMFSGHGRAQPEDLGDRAQ